MDTFTVTGPDTIVAAIPHLLGFEPEESLIVVWIAGGRISLTQRIDLPSSAEPEIAPRIASRLVATAVHAAADSVVLAVAAARGELDEDLPCRDLVEAMADEVDEAGVDLLDALLVDGDRFWSYRCTDSCCPREGRPVDQATRSRTARGFAAATPSERRSDLVGRWEADPAAVARVERLIVDLEAELDAQLGHAAAAVLEQWRDAQIETIEACLADRVALDDRQWAGVLVGLCDVRVRDTVIWSLARQPDLAEAIEFLAEGVRRAPDGYVAAIATVLALCCWQAGDGVRAGIALDRGRADDPDYSLAELVERSINAGLPPDAWRQMMRGMERDQCRVPPAA